MSIVQGIIKDLRERRLWPVAIALLAALVAVPVLLLHSAGNVPVPPTPAAGLPTSLPGNGPVVSAGTARDTSRLPGRGRDPFTQQPVRSASTTITGTTGTTRGTSGTTPGTTGTTPATTSGIAGTSGTTGSAGTSNRTGSTGVSVPGGSTGTGTGTGSSGTSPSSGTSTTTTTTSTPTPDGLTSRQSYSVALAINNSSGGFDTVDPLTRDSLVPSNKQPLLIELGVLKGGHRVLFVVQPGTVVSGPGSCTPGPIDCSILSLGENQTESLARGANGGAVPVTTFAVTAIDVEGHSSVTDANRARAEVSAAGCAVLGRSTLSALSLFRYDASTGAVLDLRNLTVGGS